MGTDATGYDIPVGDYADARAMVGTTRPVRFAEVPVNIGMIRQFTDMVHDGNASYWDERFAEDQWGGLIAPPAMLMTWLMPIEWKPGGAAPAPLLAAQVPLPGDTLINASSETDFFAPIRIGDQLNVTEELTSVSEEKTTSLGTGHFITTVSTYRRQEGEVVARSTNVLFRFSTVRTS